MALNASAVAFGWISTLTGKQMSISANCSKGTCRCGSGAAAKVAAAQGVSLRGGPAGGRRGGSLSSFRGCKKRAWLALNLLHHEGRYLLSRGSCKKA
jgi:hypothetical protein